MIPAWPVAVSVLGGWLRGQARRQGPLGDAAQLVAMVVNRSASLLSEVSAEVARATERPEADRAAKPAAPKRRPARRRSTPASGAKRAKPPG